MEIFKNNSGVSITVEELLKIYEYDFFPELISLIVSLDSTEDGDLAENATVEELLQVINKKSGEASS